MNPVVKFFHELLNPHCAHCESLRVQELEQTEINREIEIANQVCQSCENLKMQLSVMNQLVDKLTTTKTVEAVPVVEQQHRVIMPTHVPWRVKRETLEQQSRLRAEELRAEQSVKVPVPDSIQKLEEELGIDSNVGQA